MMYSKKNIAVLCYSTAWGGLELNVFRLIGWLNEFFNITLFCTQNSTLAKVAVQQSVTTVCMQKPAKRFPLSSAKKIQKELKKKTISHVIISDNLDMSLAFWTKVFSGCKIKMLYQQHMQIGISKRDLIHTIRYKMLDAWVAPLHWLTEEVKQKTRVKQNKIHIIPLGVDVEKLQSTIKTKQESINYFNINPTRLVVGILGRIDRLKNQHILLEAALMLEQEQNPIDVLIVGEPTQNTNDSYFEEIQQFVSQNNMNEHVFIRPFTNEIGYFFGAIDFFVMATDKETFGMVTLEAMLYGVPVLASNTGGSVEILEEGNLGVLYESGNSRNLAEKIKYALTHTHEIENKAQKANVLAQEKYNHTLECNKLIELINYL